MTEKAKLAIVLAVMTAGIMVIGIILRQTEPEGFLCPPTLAAMRQSLVGRTVADLRLDNGEAACFLSHVANELKMVDREGRF